jgi:hypothetical protein
MANTSQEWQTGFCALAPLRSGDCERDDSGTWIVRRRQELTASCIARCQACERCHFVSFVRIGVADLRYLGVPLGAGLCAWYTRCDLDDLRTRWETKLAGANWSTIAVRTADALQPLPLPPPPPPPRWLAPTPRSDNSSVRRLAIAALTFGAGQHCSLIAWCQGARRLQRALSVALWRAELLVLHSGEPPAGGRHCPEATYLRANAQLRRVTTACMRSQTFRTGPHPDMMLKWQFFALTQFDVVLHIDTDIDALPLEVDPQRVTRRWLPRLDLFLRPRQQLSVDSVQGGDGTGMRLLGVADHSSPLNGGMLLLRPSARLFAEGMRVIRRCRTNRTHGWELVGPPHSLGLTPRFFSLPAGGSTRSAPYHVANGYWFVPLNETVAYRSNEWSFVDGVEDQGFLWYMLFIRHDLGVYLHDLGHTGHYVYHVPAQRLEPLEPG